MITAAALAPAAVFASGPDCGAAIGRLADAVHRADHPVVAGSCKVWPHNSAVLLVAAAYDDAHEGGLTGERRLTLGVAMLSSDTRRIIALHRESLEEDATLLMGPDSLGLDTARYDLAPGVRAIGVQIGSMGPGASCPDRRFGDQLTLYARRGAALQPVFTTFRGVDAGANGDALCFTGPDADGPTVDHADITLSMGPGRSHGWADIVSRAKIERYGSGGNVESTRTADHTFRFDGVRYNTDPYSAALYWSD